MPDDAVSVPKIKQLEIGGHGSDEHPESVVRLPQVPHREGHQDDADADVEAEDQISSRRAGDEIRCGRIRLAGNHVSNKARAMLACREPFGIGIAPSPVGNVASVNFR
jgi:hypothetical protein